MRRAINDNPMLQIAVIGVLAVVVGLLLMLRMSGGDEATPAADPTAAPVTSTSPGGSGAAGSAAAPSAPSAAPTDPAAPVAPVPAGTVPPDSFHPGPGLPAPVVSAYEDGDAVVLLVTRHAGVEDRFLRSAVIDLRGRDGVAVFTTSARHIAEYARIAEGVNVNRAPALVVIRPRKLSEGATPVASVSYGFRNADGVVQAVEDALYRGRSDLPFHPE